MKRLTIKIQGIIVEFRSDDSVFILVPELVVWSAFILVVHDDLGTSSSLRSLHVHHLTMHLGGDEEEKGESETDEINV